MATDTNIAPSREFRDEVMRRGGADVARCYQCATCSSVCELATEANPFPRRQVLAAQWGLEERLAKDASVWLCHQCNDCTARCPRDAKPGDVIQAIRGIAIEKLAFPSFMGTLVARADRTWPLLLGVPLLFWVVLLGASGSLTTASLVYHNFVPHKFIYMVFFPVTGFATVAILIGAWRFWNLLGKGAARSGSFLAHLVPVLADIVTHRRFASCGQTVSRRWAHFILVAGFVLAAIASGLIIPAMYVFHVELPIAFWNPMKLLGNLAAACLAVGTVWLIMNRMDHTGRTGKATGYDWFFLVVIAVVVATGALVEVERLAASPRAGCLLYILHLASVTCLFGTFPYSKFAHMVYRTLAMVHERMAAPAGSSNQSVL
ncbi:MAG: quinone-interacting membrane-bound oxidoreductase complex subunit QmoC [Candidatus Riflebacteria bacterium]|nr:quinone-interacting membrane-bound oxidoreductase complex subunit QmoC [Candidatus Riflebacteria bacterium]